MNIKTTISISEARKKIFQIAEKVQSPSIYYTLTEKGRPKVVVMSAEEFESWVETLEIAGEFPDLKKDIKEARKDYKKGNYITLDELLKQEGYILADKLKKGNVISVNHSKKSSKRYKKNR